MFCYICGSYVIGKQRQDINSFVRNVYYAYFGIRLGDEDKSWAPHKVCRTCVEGLRPVSYTHLDVYKRQVFYSVALCSVLDYYILYENHCMTISLIA